MLNLFLDVLDRVLAVMLTVLSVKVVRCESRAFEGSQSESLGLTSDICDSGRSFVATSRCDLNWNRP